MSEPWSLLCTVALRAGASGTSTTHSADCAIVDFRQLLASHQWIHLLQAAVTHAKHRPNSLGPHPTSTAAQPVYRRCWLEYESRPDR